MLRSVLRCAQPCRRLFSTSQTLLALKTFNLTDIAEGIVEVELKSWSVEVGQKVDQFDNLCEVQSDKASAEIPSPYSGVITKLYYDVGATAKVNEPLVDIETDEDDAEPAAPAAPEEPAAPTPSTPAPPTPTPTPAATPTPTTDSSEEISEVNRTVPMAPAARLLARNNNIDATKITPTGKGGRVTKEDIVNYMASGGAAAAAATPAAPVAPPQQVSLVGDRTEEIKGIQKAMVRSMTQSLAIPSFSLGDEYELDALIQLRGRLKAYLEKEAARTGEDPVKLTFLPFFIKACSVAMHEFPVINCSLNPEATQVTYHANHNIGVAIDTPDGLIVPNIKNCESKSILEIAKDLAEISRLGRQNKIGPQYFKDGTFAISNIGTIGATYVSPVINPPNVAIMAMGKLQKVPSYNEEGEVVPLTKMAVTYTADHRIIDGATMARFSNTVFQYLKNPDLFLLNAK